MAALMASRSKRRSRARVGRLVALLMAAWAVWLVLCLWGLWIITG